MNFNQIKYGRPSIYIDGIGGNVSPAVISANFTARVIANGGSLTTTEQNAILALVTNLQANGTWNKMKLIYPMVGGTAASCAVNLVDSNYLATFSSGWTFTSTGGAPTGANTFMRAIGFNPSLVLPTNDTCFSYYSRTNNTFNGTDLGCQNTTSDLTRVAFSIYFSGSSYADLNDFTNGRIGANPSGTSGLFIMSRESSTLMKMYKRGVQLGATNTASMTSLLPNAIYSVGTLDFNDGINFSSTNRECAFSHVSTSLTSAQALAFDNSVQAFQTALSRQV
jgi:hypothetical protein